MCLANITETRLSVKGSGVRSIERFDIRRRLLLGVAAILLAGCGEAPWNDPYPANDATGNRVYSSFAERPKHLDPARSYSADEYAFLAQIYEPPLQYHFLLRPYRLVPLTALEVPEPAYFDADGNLLPQDAPAESIYRSEYLIRIQPGIRYQPHPAFARTIRATIASCPDGT